MRMSARTPMTAENDPVTQRLKALFAEYREQLPQRLETIERQLAALAADPTQRGAKDELAYALHKLAGSGSTFGYTQLSAVARQWEQILKAAASTGGSLGAPQIDRMRRLLVELKEAAQLPDQSRSDDEFRP
jgi:chemotaxis protein histidine kinase CheA